MDLFGPMRTQNYFFIIYDYFRYICTNILPNSHAWVSLCLKYFECVQNEKDNNKSFRILQSKDYLIKFEMLSSN